MVKETVGSCALKLINKSGSDVHSAIDQMREQLTDYDKNLELCVQSNKGKLEGDFYVVVITKKERLLQNVIRAYFFARISCPTPDYDQAVYKYDRATGDLRLLWIIPSQQGANMMSSNSHLVPLEQHELLSFVLRFRDGDLFELAKKENGETKEIKDII